MIIENATKCVSADPVANKLKLALCQKMVWWHQPLSDSMITWASIHSEDAVLSV